MTDYCITRTVKKYYSKLGGRKRDLGRRGRGHMRFCPGYAFIEEPLLEIWFILQLMPTTLTHSMSETKR